MKKKWIIVVAAILLVAALVCLAPWPRSLDRDFYAYDIESDERVVVSADITYYNFLFLEDKISGEIKLYRGGDVIALEDTKNLPFFYRRPSPTDDPDDYFHCVHTSYYDAEMNGLANAQVYFSQDFKKVIFQHWSQNSAKTFETYYVGSVDEETTEDELVEYFRIFLP